MNNIEPKWLKEATRHVFNIEGKDATASVFLLSNDEMEQIRERLKEIPHFTGREAEKIATEEVVEVLSFPAEGEGAPFPSPEQESRKQLGEVYINRTHASEKAEQLRLLIHGVLHLLGFSHSGKHDKMEMEHKEQEVFKTLLEQCPDLLPD